MDGHLLDTSEKGYGGTGRDVSRSWYVRSVSRTGRHCTVHEYRQGEGRSGQTRTRRTGGRRDLRLTTHTQWSGHSTTHTHVLPPPRTVPRHPPPRVHPPTPSRVVARTLRAAEDGTADESR